MKIDGGKDRGREKGERKGDWVRDRRTLRSIRKINILWRGCYEMRQLYTL